MDLPVGVADQGSSPVANRHPCIYLDTAIFSIYKLCSVMGVLGIK